MGLGNRIQKGGAMSEIRHGTRVRVRDCPNRSGQVGVAGHMVGQLRSVGFLSVLRNSPTNLITELNRGEFAAVACYDPAQLEAA